MTTPLKAPTKLPAAGRAAWRELVKLFPHLTERDIPVLMVYSTSAAIAVTCDKQIEQDGITVATQSGGLKAHPAIAVAHAARQRMLRALREMKCTRATAMKPRMDTPKEDVKLKPAAKAKPRLLRIDQQNTGG